VELLSTDLIDRARAGEEEAFRRLVDPYLAELQVHCYRILASVQDAEDALQETLLAAWRVSDCDQPLPQRAALCTAAPTDGLARAPA
jgi:DNA-directed RNA polymerase specialized sigma24 family protein